jgi:hypothetical protein
VSLLTACGGGSGGSDQSAASGSGQTPTTAAAEPVVNLIDQDLGAGDFGGDTGVSSPAASILDWAKSAPSNLVGFDPSQVGTKVGTGQCVSYVKARLEGSTRASLITPGWGGYGNQVDFRLQLATDRGISVGNIPRPGAVFHFYLTCSASLLGCSHTGIVEDVSLVNGANDSLKYSVTVAEQNFAQRERVGALRTANLSFPSLDDRMSGTWSALDSSNRAWKFVYLPTKDEDALDNAAKAEIKSWWDAGRLKRQTDAGAMLSLADYQGLALVKTVRLVRDTDQLEVARSLVGMFQSELARGADVAGLVSFLPYVAAGESVTDLQARLRNTNEYKNKHQTNLPPVLTLQTKTGSDIKVGQSYFITFAATDRDANLSRITLNWGDGGGTPMESKMVSGNQSTVTFSRTFSKQLTASWVATAYDAADATSAGVSGAFHVTDSTTNRAPTLATDSTSGANINTDQAYSITLSAADTDANLSHIDLNWNDGSANAIDRSYVNGSSASKTFTRAFSSARSIAWSATAYDAQGMASGSQNGSFTVSANVANTAPTLKVQAAPPGAINVGQSVTATLSASDIDGNLSQVIFDWGDGSGQTRANVVGSQDTSSFSHAYSNPGTMTWRATAYDTQGLASSSLSGSTTIAASQNHYPLLSLGSVSGASVPVATSYVITVNASDTDGNLSHVDLNWNDGSANAIERKYVSGSQSPATFSRIFSSPGSYVWSATAYDTTGGASGNLNGQFTVAATAIHVNGVSPTSPHASSQAQLISILGTGFQYGASVTFYDPIGTAYVCCRSASPQLVSETQIDAKPNFAGASGNWSVRVTNPDGKTSILTFKVIP